MIPFDQFMFTFVSGFAWAIALKFPPDEWWVFPFLVVMTLFSLFMPWLSRKAEQAGEDLAKKIKGRNDGR